jgi:murein DD-endopeptidase MepM/ murein hydrolase activator NlpD
MRGPGPQRYQRLGKITAAFGVPTREEAQHGGVDFANVKGTPIPSFTDGVVTKVDMGHAQGENNFGDTVEVKDAQGNTAQYHHLQKINAKLGQTIKKGQQIAQMSNTGATYSPSGQGDGTHLDFRLVNAYNQYMNPMTYVRGI